MVGFVVIVVVAIGAFTLLEMDMRRDARRYREEQQRKAQLLKDFESWRDGL